MIGPVAVYLAELDTFLDLAATLTPQHAALPTECPGWTVHDQVSHVVSAEAMFAGDPVVEHTLTPGLAHVTNPMAEMFELPVDARRGWTTARVVEEGRGVAARRRAQLADTTADDLLASPFGMRPAAKVVPLRTFDVWAHEQDVRRAVGLPVTADTEAGQLALHHIVGSFPAFLGKSVGLADGAAVRLVVGDVDSTYVGDGGKVRALTAAEGASATPTATISGDPGEFLRVCCGRITADASALQITGDGPLLAVLKPKLAMTP